jgi:hypothetical protein
MSKIEEIFTAIEPKSKDTLSNSCNRYRRRIDPMEILNHHGVDAMTLIGAHFIAAKLSCRRTC